MIKPLIEQWAFRIDPVGDQMKAPDESTSSNNGRVVRDFKEPATRSGLPEVYYVAAWRASGNRLNSTKMNSVDHEGEHWRVIIKP